MNRWIVIILLVRFKDGESVRGSTCRFNPTRESCLSSYYLSLESYPSTLESAFRAKRDSTLTILLTATFFLLRRLFTLCPLPSKCIQYSIPTEPL